MRIVNLMENTPGAEGCLYEHGLSFYLETEHHKLLMDTGASSAFLENAAVLGIDLGAVDSVILSHGHYDHGGGIPAFAAVNPRANIYMQRTAGLDYYAMNRSGPQYIGLDKSVSELKNLVLLDGDTELDGELALLAGITGRRRFARSNRKLMRREGDAYLPDSFDHEQALVVTQNGRRYLFSGCAHNGILNVLDRFRAVYGADPDVAVSGFHFMKGSEYTPEEVEDITETARELAGMDTLFYTGHCTGRPAFELMKPIMGEKLAELHSGMEIPAD